MARCASCSADDVASSRLITALLLRPAPVTCRRHRPPRDVARGFRASRHGLSERGHENYPAGTKVETKKG
ncbi:unnamed protein product [Strongylus vulgaris]|uniref:Uncharacterized protein n=1 Tax=Strongylus vulgaris TaxID=40348 RepID=A0A3P7I603_STRVU|nr:unnamed protein product [Strongylus vulgaris]